MFNWDEKAVSTTRACWSEGLSASEIAGRLGGTTRNAVIGKLHRLGLLGRSKRIAPIKPKRQPIQRPQPVPIPYREPAKRVSYMRAEPLPGPAVTDVARVAFMDLEPHHCRWPIGEPVAGFCGCDKVPGLSYCATHAARAFATPSTNRQSPQPTANNGINAVVAVQEFLAEASA